MEKKVLIILYIIVLIIAGMILKIKIEKYIQETPLRETIKEVKASCPRLCAEENGFWEGTVGYVNEHELPMNLSELFISVNNQTDDGRWLGCGCGLGKIVKAKLVR